MIKRLLVFHERLKVRSLRLDVIHYTLMSVTVSTRPYGRSNIPHFKDYLSDLHVLLLISEELIPQGAARTMKKRIRYREEFKEGSWSSCRNRQLPSASTSY
jgi:hypothetical protein